MAIRSRESQCSSISFTRIYIDIVLLEPQGQADFMTKVKRALSTASMLEDIQTFQKQIDSKGIDTVVSPVLCALLFGEVRLTN